MDKNKQPTSIYPEATRGVLADEQVPMKYQPKPFYKKVHDYAPSTLILHTVLIFLLIGLVGIGSYAYYLTNIRKTNPDTVAYAVAKKFAEIISSQTYEEIEKETASALNWCKAPVITITYNYGKIGEPKRSDNTVIDTGNIREIKPILSEIATKADTAVKSSYDIACPNNPFI